MSDSFPLHKTNKTSHAPLHPLSLTSAPVCPTNILLRTWGSKLSWVRSFLRLRVHFRAFKYSNSSLNVYRMLSTEHNHSIPHLKCAPGLALSPRLQCTQITSGIPVALSSTDKFLLVLASAQPPQQAKMGISRPRAGHLDYPYYLSLLWL